MIFNWKSNGAPIRGTEPGLATSWCDRISPTGNSPSPNGADEPLVERMQRKLEEHRAFCTDVAHELRTPLTSQIMLGENALRGRGSEADYREAIASMLEEARHMVSLIDGLKALAAASVHTHAPAPAIDLPKLVHACFESLEVLAMEKQQTLRVTGDEALQVRADPTLIRQAVTNIVHNAIDHCPEHSTITIALGRTAEWAAVAVTDNGPGIAAQDLPHVFQRFYRSESARRSRRSLGLGLAIVHAIITSQGGRIRVRSKLGKGSSFEILLPLPETKPAGSRGICRRLIDAVRTSIAPPLSQADWPAAGHPETATFVAAGPARPSTTAAQAVRTRSSTLIANRG